MDNLKILLIGKLLEMINDATSALSTRVKHIESIDLMLKPKLRKDSKGRTIVNLPIAFSMFDAIRADLCGLLISDPVIRYMVYLLRICVCVALLEKVIKFSN